MKECTKEQFYQGIGTLDVVCAATGNFPYTSVFKLRHGGMVGKIVDSYTDNEPHKYPIISRYYLAEQYLKSR